MAEVSHPQLIVYKSRRSGAKKCDMNYDGKRVFLDKEFCLVTSPKGMSTERYLVN